MYKSEHKSEDKQRDGKIIITKYTEKNERF